MPILCEHSIEVHSTPERAFALLDDLAQTPKWLGPCTAIEKLVPGPNAVGDKLKYSYQQGGRAGIMDGEILVRTPSEKLVFHYVDRMMDVSVDLSIVPIQGGSKLTHIITITPLTFMGKIMSPCIRLTLPKQTRQSMENIKKLLETT